MTFKELRLKNNLTQVELGKRVGTKQVTISQYENGQRKPNLRIAQKIAVEFKITLDEFLNVIEL